MLKAWPKPFTYFKDVRVFLISLSVIITLFISVVFFFRYLSTSDLLYQRVREQAASYAHLIVLMRHWNAQYGGVYVEKKIGRESNPYLLKLGIQPDLTTTDGKTLTLRNPAIMTREISQLASNQDQVQFRLVSLLTVNPENTPDAFERQALIRFSRNPVEIVKLDRSGGRPVFRYIQPLIIEDPCLKCHAQQGYRLGGIRGGISVLIPAESLIQNLRKNRLEIFGVAVVTIGTLLSILYFMTWQLVRRLDRVQKKLKQIAVTDELTGLKNRRYIMEHLDQEFHRAFRARSPLSLIVVDIDHFKKVNDTYGHSFGDVVLRAVADELKVNLRGYDLLGRIGGEEFLIASPGSSKDDARGLAERIVSKIRSKPVQHGDQAVSITVSAGVAAYHEQDQTSDTVFNRADAALYEAKRLGRDRVTAF